MLLCLLALLLVLTGLGGLLLGLSLHGHAVLRCFLRRVLHQWIENVPSSKYLHARRHTARLLTTHYTAFSTNQH